MIEKSRQYELIFEDLVSTIADRKRTIFDLSRWIVTLQGLVIAAAASKEIPFSFGLIFAPLVIGAVGMLLHNGLHAELLSHRMSLAVLRDRVGGPFAELNADFQNTYLHGARKTDATYWWRIALSHQLIILGSTGIAAAACLHFE